MPSSRSSTLPRYQPERPDANPLAFDEFSEPVGEEVTEPSEMIDRSVHVGVPLDEVDGTAVAGQISLVDQRSGLRTASLHHLTGISRKASKAPGLSASSTVQVTCSVPSTRRICLTVCVQH